MTQHAILRSTTVNPSEKPTMKLLGSYRSPYVRRVAASLNLMDIAYEHDAVPVFDDPDAVKTHNPLVRVPTLVLDDGEALVESYAILDALDDMAGDNRLTPASGADRRNVMKLTAVGTGTMDKTVWAVYEGRFHPKEKYHKPWVEHNEAQAIGGLGFLDECAKAAGDNWLAGDSISQADVTAAVAFAFAKMARPKLDVDAKFTALSALSARCEAMDAFSSVTP